MAVLVHPELSFKVMGMLFKIHNKLGSSRTEKIYQRALEHELKGEKVPYKKEKLVKLKYEGNIIGDYFLDFVIDDKIVLELKAKDYYNSKDVNQLIAYLKTLGLPLGILVNFRSDRLKYKRIVNPDISTN